MTFNEHSHYTMNKEQKKCPSTDNGRLSGSASSSPVVLGKRHRRRRRWLNASSSFAPQIEPRLSPTKNNVSWIWSFKKTCKWYHVLHFTAYHNISQQLNHNNLYIYIYIWANYNNSLTWIKAHLGMISLTNHDFQWARSELVIIYPDIYIYIYYHLVY